jgi:hypothetical protein
MFLDEKLYNRVKETEHNSGESFNELINDLYNICQDHYKPLLPIPGTPEGTFKNIRILLDRTFASWDLFVKRLEKEGCCWFIFMLKDHSFKNELLKNPEMKQIYDRGR